MCVCVCVELYARFFILFFFLLSFCFFLNNYFFSIRDKHQRHRSYWVYRSTSFIFHVFCCLLGFSWHWIFPFFCRLFIVHARFLVISLFASTPTSFFQWLGDPPSSAFDMFRTYTWIHSTHNFLPLFFLFFFMLSNYWIIKHLINMVFPIN